MGSSVAIGTKVISADDHVVEAPDTWTARMSKTKWGERIPRIESNADGAFAFGAVKGWFDVRYGARDGSACAEFSWEGVSDARLS